MALQTLPFYPTYSTRPKGTVKARVLSVAFGDGYSQRAADGINTTLANWDCTWVLDATDGQTLLNFFDTHGGHTPFNWAPPRSQVAYTYLCAEWAEEAVGNVAIVITGKFEQVISHDT